MNDSRSLARQSGFGFAGALILLGVFGLLWNFNVLPDGFWGEFWTLWPLLLVAIGANLILSRQRAWIGSLAALAVVTGSLAAAWVLAVANPPSSHSLSINTESISVKSDGAQSARLNLILAAGDLTLTSGAPVGAVALRRIPGGHRRSVGTARQREQIGSPEHDGRASEHRLELPVPSASGQFVFAALDPASRRRHSIRYPYRDGSIGP